MLEEYGSTRMRFATRRVIITGDVYHQAEVMLSPIIHKQDNHLNHGSPHPQTCSQDGRMNGRVIISEINIIPLVA